VKEIAKIFVVIGRRAVKNIENIWFFLVEKIIILNNLVQLRVIILELQT